MYHLLKLFREVAPHPPGRGIRIGELGMRRLQFLQLFHHLIKLKV